MPTAWQLDELEIFWESPQLQALDEFELTWSLAPSTVGEVELSFTYISQTGELELAWSLSYSLDEFEITWQAPILQLDELELTWIKDDTLPPYLTLFDPVLDDVIENLSPTMIFHVRDDEFPIDITTVHVELLIQREESLTIEPVYVDEVFQVGFTDSTQELADALTLKFTIVRDTAFLPDDEVMFRVDACDTAPNPNCATNLVYYFYIDKPYIPTLDPHDYTPKRLKRWGFWQEVLDDMYHTLKVNEKGFEDILDKTKNPTSLGKPAIEAITKERGYGYIYDLLALPRSKVRNLMAYLIFIHFLKGHRDGLEMILRLLGVEYTLTEWWEDPGNVSTGFFELVITSGEEETIAGFKKRLNNFLMNYVYPLRSATRRTIEVPLESNITAGFTARFVFSAKATVPKVGKTFIPRDDLIIII